MLTFLIIVAIWMIAYFINKGVLCHLFVTDKLCGYENGKEWAEDNLTKVNMIWITLIGPIATISLLIDCLIEKSFKWRKWW